jgi:hypothetical protein
MKAKAVSQYHIKTRQGYVVGYDAQFQCVSFTSAEYRSRYAKKFASAESAKAFANKYAEGGFGMPSAFTVVPA